MGSTRRWTMVAAACLGVACGTDGGGDDGQADAGTSTTIPPVSTTAETTTQAESTQGGTVGMTSMGTTVGADDTGPAATGPIFDVGAPDVGQSEGCKNVDFLFVIDNSGSMTEQQQRLLDSFPGFITAIQSSLTQVESYHVGVMTSDAYFNNEAPCGVLGGLVTQTTMGACGPFVEGHRFITEQDDLATAFQCIGQVGTSGSGIEQPVSALVAGVQPPLTSPGGCNDGFLRDDAIFVVVIVTDDPPYSGTNDDALPLLPDISVWHDPVLAAKNGNPDAVVVIGFVPWGDLSCVCPWCCPGEGCNAPSPNLIDFVQSWGTQGVLASVCEADYSPIFAATIDTIDATCAGFDPPG